MAVALTLEGASLALATISLPLAACSPSQMAADAAFDPQAAPDLLPAPLPPACARLAAALSAVRALASPELPFAALPASTDALRVVAPKAKAAQVYKGLRAQAASLGVVVGAVKDCISLAPLPADELQAAAAAGLVASLVAAGWHRLDEDRVLAASPLAPVPDGGAQACGSLTLRVRGSPGGGGGSLTLLVKAEHVEFRHPACRPLGAASLAERSARLAGAPCRLLPDLRPALVECLRPADAPTLARLRPLWAAYGQPLPASVEHLAEVRLDCDPDAPTFPYPPCRLLGQDGLATLADRLAAPAVQAVLARLRDDLVSTPLKFFGDALRVAPLAREWHPDGPPPAARGRAAALAPSLPPLAFTTARQLAEAGGSSGSSGFGGGGGGEGGAGAADLHLGAELAVADWKAGAEGSAAGTGGPQRQRRQYAPVPPKLQAAFDEAKRQLAEAERPAVAARPSAAAATGSAAPAAAPAKQPLALRMAAAAATGGSGAKPGVPQFKKMAAPAGTAAAKKGAGAGQKRAAAGKPPPAPKRPKAAKPVAAAKAAAAVTVPAGGAVPDTAAAAASQAAASAAAPSQAPPSSAAAGGAQPLAAAGTSAAAATAAPKAPAKPRKKAADIDVAAATAKVLQAHAAGTLGSLTVPELKAYLKSVKAPVGGKKGDLEERVRQRLGSGGGGGAGEAADTAAAAPASVAAS